MINLALISSENIGFCLSSKLYFSFSLSLINSRTQIKKSLKEFESFSLKIVRTHLLISNYSEKKKSGNHFEYICCQDISKL